MQPIVAIVGPTASGKTGFGVHLAEELDGEIVNADALQVYRGFDIGTDKPSPELRRAIPHHLLDVLEPEEPYSAGEFVRRARPVIREIEGRGRVPILIGGSGLYLRALLEGLSPIPEADPEVRRRLEERLRSDGLEVLYGELRELDPATADRLPPRDRQRILRALEVRISSGRPLSEWLRTPPPRNRRLPAVKVGLTVPRTILYDRIAGRVQHMIERGWVEEVMQMLERGVDPQAPAFQAIGYRQIVQYVRGNRSLETAVEDTIRATRHYAKRQLTWFRKEKDVRWISTSDLERDMPSLLREWKSGGRVAQ